MALHVFNDKDVREFKAMKAKLDRLTETNADINSQDVPNQASDIYLIKVPSGGIPPLVLGSPDSVTSTTVQVHDIDDNDEITDPGFTIDVYNVSLSTIVEAAEYAIATKSKFGAWLVGTPEDDIASTLIVRVPTGGIVGVTLSSTDTVTGVTCDIYEINSSDELIDTLDTVEVFNVSDDTLLFEDSTYWVVRLEERTGKYVFGEVTGGSGGCDGIVDPDDCWIGCRSGTGSGMGTDDADNPDTLFHKRPYTDVTEADCTLVRYIDNVNACWTAFDDGGHFFGYFHFSQDWISEWDVSEPPGPFA